MGIVRWLGYNEDESLRMVGTKRLNGQRSLAICFTNNYSDMMNKEFHHDTETMPLTLSLLYHNPLSIDSALYSLIGGSLAPRPSSI